MYNKPLDTKSIYIPETIRVSNLKWQFLNQFQRYGRVSHLSYAVKFLIKKLFISSILAKLLAQIISHF